MIWFYSLLTFIAITYGVKAIMLYRRQGDHVYHPSREWIGTPQDVDLAYEDIQFHTVDNIRLHGWYCPHTHSNKAILLFHGNTGNISDCLESLRQFAELGYNTFVFDYRGYGHSSGHPDEAGTYADADAAWAWLLRERHYAPGQVVIVGRSLGAAIAVHLACRHRPAAVILESTFTSLPDIAAETHRLLPVRWMTRFKYDTLSRIAQIHSPIMIIHSREDQIIGFHHGEHLYTAANEPKRFMPIEGDHATGFLNSGTKYSDGLQDFLRQHSGKDNANV